MKKYVLCFFLFFLSIFVFSQTTRKDTLLGSNTLYRNRWEVLRYDLTIEPDYTKKYLTGKNIITAKVLSKDSLIPIQLDLQEPMKITKIHLNQKEISGVKKDGNFYFFEIHQHQLSPNKTFTLEVFFEGHPQIAQNPPWDGGWVFTQDERGNPWMSVACQGIGASVWYPMKELQEDEPEGCTLTIIVDKELVGIGNGRLIKKEARKDKISYIWEVKNPINAYNIVPYIGKYVHFSDVFQGEKGTLDLDFWVLEDNLKKAQKHFQVKPMLNCFEQWFGPYPFYEDGYKLVEAPYLGMEHQSNIAYGNQYLNGYLGRDLSRTGEGEDWDYLIVHESGHEWFGNNITAKDMADLWIHEGFTSYSELLFIECLKGKKSADTYIKGFRKTALNDMPIIGEYEVRKEGSSDMYHKAANMIHTIRQLVNDDEKFKSILRNMNRDFYHKTVSSKVLEFYMEEQAGVRLNTVFNQYLRTTDIPVLEIKKEKDGTLYYRWTECIENFDMKLRLKDSNEWIYPTTEWKKSEIQKDFTIDTNFYIKIRIITS